MVSQSYPLFLRTIYKVFNYELLIIDSIIIDSIIIIIDSIITKYISESFVFRPNKTTLRRSSQSSRCRCNCGCLSVSQT